MYNATAADFLNMPAIEHKTITDLYKCFPQYLFFEKVKTGVRKYTCTACGKTFKRGSRVQLRTETQNDRVLENAPAGSYCTCPECGVKAMLKMAKNCARYKLNDSKFYLLFLPVSENEVWFRGYEIYQRYWENDILPRLGYKEWCRYKLTPGAAAFYRLYSGGFYRESTVTEPFSWNHGVYTEKYDWSILNPGDKTIDDTFLKYSAFDLFSQYCYTAPIMKYLSWYAIHPQIEMLTKLGHCDVINQMLFENTDTPSFLDWKASKPWDLFKISHAEYNEWKRLGAEFDVLKVYKRLGYRNPKDFAKARHTLVFFEHAGKMKRLINVNSLAKKEGKTAYDAVIYFEKQSMQSAGMCHCCPGVSPTEIYRMWLDYVSMQSSTKDGFKNAPYFPHDLKARHDKLVKQSRAVQLKNRKREQRKYIKELEKKYIKKFPLVKTRYEEFGDLYNYSNDEYIISAPKSIEDILNVATELELCIASKGDIYFDRIERNETYIFFCNLKCAPDMPWYVIEAEPNGTIRQFRTYGDVRRKEDAEAAMPFLRDWQRHLQETLPDKYIKLGAASDELREAGFKDLRKTKKTINYGEHRGQLLVDVLEHDLIKILAS